jgi:hypothetical protein
MTKSDWFLPVGMQGCLVLAALAVASCTSPSSSSSSSSSSRSLQQVEATNPSVTYEYAGDSQLLEAQQKAVAFCAQYQSSPRPARITSSSDGGSNNVVFECDPNLPVTAPPVVTGSDLAYSYRNDQELLAAWRNAETYCTGTGRQAAVPDIHTNPDGSKTVVFRCT